MISRRQHFIIGACACLLTLLTVTHFYHVPLGRDLQRGDTIRENSRSRVTHPPPSNPPQYPVTQGPNNDALDERLEKFLKRPILSHEEMLPINLVGCPRDTFFRDQYFWHSKDTLNRWASFSTDDIRSHRHDLVRFMRDLQKSGANVIAESNPGTAPISPTPSARQPYRGIIYSGGDGRTFDRLKISLHMLRNVIKSDLPVEIVNFPGEWTNDAAKAELVEKFGPDLTVKELSRRDNGWGYQIKTLAFIETDFDEFIWMDQDNIPLQDPMELFESFEFARHGNVFWSDVVKDHPHNAIWRFLGRPCSDDYWQSETGQVLFSKHGNGGLNLAALHIAHYMISHGMWQEMSFGDKDLWRYAFYVLGIDYFIAPRVAAFPGQKFDKISSTPDRESEFCGHANLYWGLTPQAEAHNERYRSAPAFLHANVAKFFPDRTDPAQFIPYVQRPRHDGSTDRRLIRTPSQWTLSCLVYSQYGPDGAADAENSYGDDQAAIIVIEPLKEIFRDADGVMRNVHVYEALMGDVSKMVVKANTRTDRKRALRSRSG